MATININKVVQKKCDSNNNNKIQTLNKAPSYYMEKL